MYSEQKDPTPQKYLNIKVPFMSVQVRQLHIFGPKCLHLNNVVITIQSLLGSVGFVKFLMGISNFVVDLHACVIQQMLKKTNSYRTGIAQARIFICCKTKTKQNKTKNYIILQKTLQLSPIHPFLVLRQRTSMSSPGSLGTEHENPTTGKREGAQRHHRSVV